MILHNQTNKHLDFTLTGHGTFKALPFGQVDVPDQLVEACKARKLPLGHTPVAPALKAEAISEEEKANVRADELRQTKEALALSKVGEKEAKEAAERSQVESGALRRELEAARATIAEREETIRSLTADKDAAEDLLREVTQKLTDTEHQLALTRRLQGENPEGEAKGAQAPSAPAGNAKSQKGQQRAQGAQG